MPPDILTENEIMTGQEIQSHSGWVVRLERRDMECQFRFIDTNGNINSRLSAAMRMDKEVAKQYAKAITDGHEKYRARAMLYSTMRKKQEVD